MDRRLWALLLIVCAASALTALAIRAGWWLNPSTFKGAVFASWVAGLAFFAIIGVVGTILSVARPEDDSFDARARILFRKQSGKHIDYIVSRIGEVLEHYAKFTEVKTCIVSYRPVNKKYRVITEVESCISSYIDDAETTYTSNLRLSGATPVPPGQPINEVRFLRVNDTAIPNAAQSFTSDLDIPFETVIAPKQDCKLEHCIEFWIKADPVTKSPTDPHIYRPARYTQKIRLVIENRLTESVLVAISKDAGATWENVELTPGNAKAVFDTPDLRPGLEAYRYRILPREIDTQPRRHT